MTRATLEYVRIKDTMRQLVGRQWPVGMRLPPIRTLAQQMGVGQCNALRAVRELASEGVFESRQRRGTFVANPVARVAGNASGLDAYRAVVAGKTVAMISYEAESEPFIHQMQNAIENVLTPLGAITKSIYMGSATFDQLGQIDADALVLLNYSPAMARWREDQIMLTVTTVADAWASMPGGYDIVSVDQEQGAFLAGRRLLQAGFERAAFLGVCRHLDPRQYDATSTARLVGFQRGWGRMLSDEHLLTAKYYDPVQAGSAAAQYLARHPRPQAVFAATDELAVGFIAGVSAHGLEVGRDVHVIGFDGQRIGRELQPGPLTTVTVPAASMGETGARLLVERFAEPGRSVRRVHLGCTLFEGATVASPSKDGS